MKPNRGWLAVNLHYERLISTVAPGSKHSIKREKVLKALLADGALLWPFSTVTPEKPSNFSDERVKGYCMRTIRRYRVFGKLKGT